MISPVMPARGMGFLVLCAVLAAWTPLMQVEAQSSSARTVIPPTSVTTNPPSSSPVRSSTPKPSTASSTSTGIPAAVTHSIQVGLADHKFKPDTVRTAKGDTVEFSFFPQNHSVVRAEWGIPCIPYEMTGPGKPGSGFFSGFKHVESVLSNPPKFSIVINDTDPMFFYCSAPGSCTTYGMVGVINPNASTSLDEQRNLALKADFALSPGEPFPAESPTLTPAPAQSSSSAHLGAGAIAGIVIACLAVVALGALLFFFWGRFKGLRDELRRKDSTVVRTTSPRSPTAPWNRGAASEPSPGYTNTSPMSSHAKPDMMISHLPPAYFHSPSPPPMPEIGGYRGPPPFPTSATATNTESGVSRSASHRSTRGTFEFSPKGYYVRTNDAPSYTSDMTSPTDPSFVPTGPYGRQLRELQRVAARNSGSATSEGGYFDPAHGRPVVTTAFHMAHKSPVEIEDTSGTAGVRPPHSEDDKGRHTPVNRF